MENKQVLYISYDGMTDPLGQSQVLPYLSGLSELGYRFTLVSCEKPDALAKRKDVIDDICRNTGIDWHPLPYTKRPPVLSTILDLNRIKSCCRKILKKKPHSIVHARGHYITSLAALSLCKEFPMKYIFDMRGFWADERVDGGLWPEKHPVYRTIYRYFKRKEKLFLEQADQIITLTERAKEELATWQHIERRPLPVEVIPCCADLDHFDYKRIPASDTLALKQKYHIPASAFVLGYLGSFGTWYMNEEMVQLFRVILQERPESYFFVVTNDDKSHISELLHKYGVPASRVVITGTDREHVPLYLSVFDVGLFFIRPTFSKKASSPVKHGEMMGMGIPLICNQGIGDVDRIVENGTGYVLKDFSDKAYQEVAVNLDVIRRIPKAFIRNQGLHYYDLRMGTAKYADIYHKLLS